MVLVHYKEPNGILYIGSYKIHGSHTGMPPTDVDMHTYKMNRRTCLKEATYREAYLKLLFEKPFSMIAFTYKELGKITPEVVLDRLIKEIDIEGPFKNRRAKVLAIKKAIVEASKRMHL